MKKLVIVSYSIQAPTDLFPVFNHVAFEKPLDAFCFVDDLKKKDNVKNIFQNNEVDCYEPDEYAYKDIDTQEKDESDEI